MNNFKKQDKCSCEKQNTPTNKTKRIRQKTNPISSKNNINVIRKH